MRMNVSGSDDYSREFGVCVASSEAYLDTEMRSGSQVGLILESGWVGHKRFWRSSCFLLDFFTITKTFYDTQ